MSEFDASELPMPPKQLVRVIHALIEGLVIQRIQTPELCPGEVFYAASGALAKRHVAPVDNRYSDRSTVITGTCVARRAGT